MSIIGKINDKVLLDDCVLREESEVLTRWIDPTIQEKDKEIERLNNKIKEYETNTIPTLEHNIDVLVDSEDRLNNIIDEISKTIKWAKKEDEYQGAIYEIDNLLKEGKEDE